MDWRKERLGVRRPIRAYAKSNIPNESKLPESRAVTLPVCLNWDDIEPGGYLGKLRSVSDCHSGWRALLAFGVQGSRMLNDLQCIGQSHKMKKYSTHHALLNNTSR